MASGPDGLELRFVGWFTPQDLERVKTLPGASWDPSRKRWILPDDDRTRAGLHERFGDRVSGLPPADRPDTTHLRLRREFQRVLLLRGYRPRTRKVYLGHVDRFLRWWEDRPGTDPPTLARDYILHLVQERKVSRSYHNQAVSALRLLLKDVVEAPLRAEALPRPRHGRHLPEVLSKDEVKRLLDAIRGPKYRALVMLLYSAGLRVGEVVRLRPEDLDAHRGLLRVRRGKGGKDRYTLLSSRALDAVRIYHDAFRPETWLFPGRDPARPLTTRSVQRAVRVAADQAGLGKRVTPHTLRHSFATHLLESGTGLRHIQELLGHSTSRTTDIYTHVANTELARITSPMDDLE